MSERGGQIKIDLIIIKKITQSGATNYFSTLNGERHSAEVIYSILRKSHFRPIYKHTNLIISEIAIKMGKETRPK